MATFVLFLPSLKLVTDHHAQIDWDKATTNFQCASVSSMKTMTYGILKKVENAGGKVGVAASTPTATPKKARGKKRKTTSADEEDDDESTPVIKKKGRKTNKTAEAPADCKLLWMAAIDKILD